MDLVEVKNVELMSVGMRWPSANGEITFQFQHLEDALVAANSDPHVVAPRLKLGHSDPRLNPEEVMAEQFNPYFDGEPAVGSVYNLRLVNDGATLVGDFRYVPAWLAEMLPSAYPSRSVEGAYMTEEGPLGEAIGTWDVETPGGKRYSFVLTAVALLGISRPAVQDLDDLQQFLTMGEGVVVAGAAPDGGQPVAASIGPVKPPAELAADIDKLVESFCSDFCEDERYWWWPRSIWADEATIIADDDEGNLWAVKIHADADQNVTFDEPERKLEVFVDAPEPAAASQAVRAAAAMSGIPTASNPDRIFASRADTPLAERKKGTAAGGLNASGSVSAMKVSSLRAALATLPDEATDEQIAEALAAQSIEVEAETPEGDSPATPPASPDDPPAENEDAEATEGDEADKPPADAPAASAAPSPTVAVDREVLAELRSNAKLGAEARAQQVDNHRAAVLSAALETGKILPASKAAWDRKLIATPAEAEAELSALPEGLVPLSEDGHSISSSQGAELTADAVVESWFPTAARQEAV